MTYAAARKIINRGTAFTLEARRKLRDVVSGIYAAIDTKAATASADFTALTASGMTLSTEAGTGITTGTGTIYETSRVDAGGIITTTILLDITGLRSTGAGDIIGVDGTALACHLGQVTAADCGVVFSVEMRCLEAAAGGNTDIDLYSATEATGTEDDAITGLTETQIINAGVLSIGGSAFGQTIAADQYLYLVAVGATDADYTAGKFEITIKGQS